MNYSALLLTLLTTLSTSTWAVELTQVHQGEVISVTLSELKPTQPSVGYDQIYYKLGRYQHDAEKQFDEICEANGQKGVSKFDAQSQPAVATSFQCKAPVGTERQDMKTVVIAPNNQLYLTDGHHTFNTFWHMDGGAAHSRFMCWWTKIIARSAPWRRSGNSWRSTKILGCLMSTISRFPTSSCQRNLAWTTLPMIRTGR